MEEKKLTEKESLELIAQMIEVTKNNFEGRNGNMFILWGYISAVITLIVYLGWHYTGNPSVFWCWFAIPVIGYPFQWIINRKSPKRAITFIDQVVGQVWGVFGVCAILTPLIAGVFGGVGILFVESLLVSMCVAITGLIVKYKMIGILGFVSILLSFSLLFARVESQILIFVGLFVILMIIPGHILNAASARKIKNNSL